ncbi:low molecular weight phosphatase family protein [Cnuibacter sp. UC19_7]|uniref:arsenate reductase/protein-tyrosine-phosphatase family protein n=1 Tax=Cnuibacter sp. UC19_7 TaxID=3350166 RepID=UPI0036716809
MAKFSVLTVCTGNICRSPMAEQILRARLADFPALEFSSAGTYAGEGDLMPEQAAALSLRHGGDPSTHRARYLTETILGGADLVLGMSRNHRREIVELLPKMISVTFTLREFSRLSAGLTDDEIRRAASMGLTVKAALAEVVALVASRRGQTGVATSSDEDDVVDPYRRSDETYERSAQQLVPAAERVAHVLRTAVDAFRP